MNRRRKPLRHTRDGTPPFAVPAMMLAELLEEHIERLNKELSQNTDNPNPRDPVGAITYISHRVSQTLKDIEPESVPRRIHSVRHGEFARTSTEIADALLMACGVLIEDTNLPTFPSTRAAAREMVKVWAPEFKGLAKKQLEEQLFRFAQGFLQGLHDDPETLIDKHEKHEAKLAAAARERELVAA